ncbi:hypothetical protein [Brevundimonas sp.]|uniref:hypothetical protein n=1 Tax=Brevundimonas sp. TaxID=1871086 RepID=UPI0035633D3E
MEAGLDFQTGDLWFMETIDFEVSSRRRHQGGGGFDVKKPRFTIGVGKPLHRRRFRLIVSDCRDKRAIMMLVRKRPDCAEFLVLRFPAIGSRPIGAA